MLILLISLIHQSGEYVSITHHLFLSRIIIIQQGKLPVTHEVFYLKSISEPPSWV